MPASENLHNTCTTTDSRGAHRLRDAAALVALMLVTMTIAAIRFRRTLD